MQSTMNTQSTSSSSIDQSVDGYTWEYNLPRVCPSEIIEMEEKEREDRMNRGVNPLIYGRLIRVQAELMNKHTFWNEAKSSLTSAYSTAKQTTIEKSSFLSGKFHEYSEKALDAASNWQESAKGMIQGIEEKSKEFSVATNQKANEIVSSLSKGVEKLDEKSQEFSVATNQSAADMKESLSEKMSEVKEGSSKIFDDVKGKMGEIKLTAQEERERARRMNAKPDSALEFKRDRVQSELIQNVKLVN